MTEDFGLAAEDSDEEIDEQKIDRSFVEEPEEEVEIPREFITVRFRDAWFGNKIRAIRKRTVALLPTELKEDLPKSAVIIENGYKPEDHPSFRFVDLRDVDTSIKPLNAYSEALAKVHEKDTRTSLKEFDAARDGLA